MQAEKYRMIKKEDAKGTEKESIYIRRTCRSTYFHRLHVLTRQSYSVIVTHFSNYV